MPNTCGLVGLERRLLGTLTLAERKRAALQAMLTDSSDAVDRILEHSPRVQYEERDLSDPLQRAHRSAFLLVELWGERCWAYQRGAQAASLIAERGDPETAAATAQFAMGSIALMALLQELFDAFALYAKRGGLTVEEALAPLPADVRAAMLFAIERVTREAPPTALIDESLVEALAFKFAGEGEPDCPVDDQLARIVGDQLRAVAGCF